MSLGFAAALPCSAGPTGSLNDQQANSISLLNSFLKTRSWGHLWCPGDPLFHRPSHPRLPQRLPRTRRERRLLPPGGDMLRAKHICGSEMFSMFLVGESQDAADQVVWDRCPLTVSSHLAVLKQVAGDPPQELSGTFCFYIQQVLTSSHKVQHRGQDT